MGQVAPLPKRRLARQEPANVGLTRELLTYLTSGEITPGQRLPGERALSESFGVGRAALREAIKSLILLGVLEQRQGDGTYLTREPSSLLPKVVEWGLLLGKNQLTDLIEARQLLEVTLAPLAAMNRSEDAVERLSALIDEMEASGDDYDRYIEADVQFHMELAAASGNEVLTGVLSNIRSLVHVWAKRVIGAAQETETSLAMHVPILKAVVAGDPDEARRAMQALMDRATRRLNESLADSDLPAITS
jgi:GntR family transcriptional repressor for pyruvate dehydrogenase complex